MKKEIQKVARRNQAIFITDIYDKLSFSQFNETTSVLIANARKLGFSFSEAILKYDGRPFYPNEIVESFKQYER